MSRISLEQRKALGSFLASRRNRVKPGEIGLSAGPRRTPGLRREEVAVLSGVSVSWYTWIEQGRDVQASVETLRRVATVLRLNNAETAHLFALAQPVNRNETATERLSDGLELLVRAMDPVPAYVRNSRFDILAWNESITGLFLDFGALRPHERNTVRLMFTYAPYRKLILNWEAVAKSYVSSLRAARTRAADKNSFDRLITELSEASSDFSTWWSEGNVAAFDEGCKRIRHPSLGDVEYIYLSMSPEKQPDLSVVVYLLRASARESES